MENLKKLMEKINTNNPSDFDIRLISLKNYYVSLKKNRDIKKFRRLKLLVHLYPKLIERNNFHSIQAIVENPLDRTLVIREKEHIMAIEYNLAKKYNCNFNPDYLQAVFRVSDLYDYFGLGD